MTEIPNSTFLDFQAYGLTSATTVGAAYGFDTGSAFAAPTDSEVTVALVLNRATDPTQLLNEDWGTRQQTLASLQADGTLWTTYGASQNEYNDVVNALGTLGISVLSTSGFESSAASQTVWVQLNPTQFQNLFQTGLMYWNGNDVSGDGMLFWNNGLTLSTVGTVDLASDITGVWVSNVGGSPTPNAIVPGDTLVSGPQSLGNTSTEVGTLYPNAISQFYQFPLTGSDATTSTIGLIEPDIGDTVPEGSDFQQLLDSYRNSDQIGTPGTYYVDNAAGISTALGGSSGERSLDVGVVSSVDPQKPFRLVCRRGWRRI